MTLRKALVVTTQVVIVVLVACYGSVRYLTTGPDTTYEAAQLPSTHEELFLAEQLKRHVETLAVGERNLAHYDQLEKAAAYIELTLRGYAYTVARQDYTVDGKVVRNIEAVVEPAGNAPDPDVIVLGAHYDSALGTPGADANASGTAAVLELARQIGDYRTKSSKRLRFVFFVNGAPPYFQTADMGSLRYAQALVARRERVTAMYAFDSLGYYTDARGTQTHAPLLGLMLPDRGDFVAFVGRLPARRLARDTHKIFRTYTEFPSFSGVGLSLIPGVDWSDNWAFAEQGFPAVLVTDTGPFRNPNYGKASDTAGKVDVDKLARVVKGMEAVMRETLR
jgi:hypothetical protein